MTKRVVAVALLCGLVSCGPADAERAAADAPRPPPELPQPSGDTIRAEIAHVLTGEDGPYPFGLVTSVDFGPGGTVVVADQYDGRILVFDSAGRLERGIGRPGGGPGEIQRPSGLRVYDDSTIYVLEQGLDWLERFSWDGSSLSSRQVSYRGQQRPWLGVFADSPKALIDSNYDSSPGPLTRESLFWRSTIANFELDGRGILSPAETRTKPVHRPSGAYTVDPAGRPDSLPHPYSAMTANLWSVGEGRLLAYLSQDSTELLIQEVFHRGDSILASIDLGDPGDRPTIDRERAEQYLRSWNREVRRIPEIPQLPFYSVYVDGSERIWVNTKPILDITHFGEAPETMLFHPPSPVFDIAILPGGVRPHNPFFRADGDRALAVVQDDFDRDLVYVMRLRQGR